MEWSEEEVRALAGEYFRNRAATCPRDRTSLKVQELRSLGRKTADLFLRCPRCGASATWQNEEPVGEFPTWRRTERARIVDEYWQQQFAQCPTDGSVLHISESKELGHAETPLLVSCPRCGRRFMSDEPAVDEPMEEQTFLSRYQPIKKLGAGGMGVVELVRDRRSGKECAAKTIAPEKLRDPQALERFRREIAVLRGLSHPCVVKILDDFEDEERSVYVMEYLAGGDFATAIADARRTPRELAELFTDAAEGVTFLHENGVIHRDLKPGNVLIGGDGRARVSDFGLAIPSEREGAITRTGEFLGTMLYAAPEQLRGARDVDEKADIYSLGVIAIEVVSRRRPKGDHSEWTGGTDELARVLKVALNQIPSRRTVSPGEISAAVRARCDMEMARTETASPVSGQSTGEEFRRIGEVHIGRVDSDLGKLQLRRSGGRGHPGKGQLYLGRSLPDESTRGVFVRLREPAPGGFSAADLFEFVERASPGATPAVTIDGKVVPGGYMSGTGDERLLAISLTNSGTRTVEGWRIDVEVPVGVREASRLHERFVENRGAIDLFRVRQVDQAEPSPIFPGDTVLVFEMRYPSRNLDRASGTTVRVRLFVKDQPEDEQVFRLT